MKKWCYHQSSSDEFHTELSMNLAESFDRDHVFVDVVGENKKWKSLLIEMKQDDELYISSIHSFARNTDDLLYKLTSCSKKGVLLKIQDHERMTADSVISIVNFVNDSNRKRNYDKQMEGIRKALDEKKQGLRTYGRPSVGVPEDFIENLKRIAKKEMTHDEYRKKIGMKKSTYFAKVKEYKG